EMSASNKRYLEFGKYMFNEISENFETAKLNGHPTQRLAHNLSISIPGIESRAVIVQLKNVAISTGSACTSATVEPSHVLMALSDSPDRAHSTIRIGFGRSNT